MWDRFVSAFRSVLDRLPPQVPLFEAIDRRDADAVARWLRRNAPPNVHDLPGLQVALWQAVQSGHLRIVTLLVEHGVDLNARVNDGPGCKVDPLAKGRPVLMAAAERGDPRIVRYLLDHGADVNIPDDRGQTALHVAALWGRTEVVSVLLEYGADVNHRSERGVTALHYAAGYGRTSLVNTLLIHGAQIDAQDEEEETPLIRAASGRHGPTIEVLVAAGASRELENKCGKTAWHLALQTGAPVAHDLLQPAHVDPNLALISRLIGAVAQKDAATVREFLAAGADPNLHRQGCRSPLIYAVELGQTEIVRILLEHEADVNARGPWGRTALIEAAASCDEHLEIVQLLLEHGADVNLADNYGHTSLIEALMHGHKAIVQMLLAAGAAVNVRTPAYTALHCAACRGDAEMVQLLVAHGADVNAQATDGETALECARARGYREIVALLERAGARR
jgi:ankyrin repeat protein